jgi:hypothetical protein
LIAILQAGGGGRWGERVLEEGLMQEGGGSESRWKGGWGEERERGEEGEEGKGRVWFGIEDEMHAGGSVERDRDRHGEIAARREMEDRSGDGWGCTETCASKWCGARKCHGTRMGKWGRKKRDPASGMTAEMRQKPRHGHG